jgi:hypothetical protein
MMIVGGRNQEDIYGAALYKALAQIPQDVSRIS